jgi:NAD(P)H-hydrate epimerase
MRAVLTAAEMRQADRRTIEEIGLPGAVLMENAGAAVARVILERFPGARHPAVLCGKGNNGGDGFAAARRLLGLRPQVVLLGARADMAGDARLHMGAYERSGGAFTEVPDEAAWPGARERLRGADLLVDALLGTGLRKEPGGVVGQAVAEIARRGEAGTPVVAVDIPSGISSDEGEVPGLAVTASVTVTFGAPKYGHVLPPACDHIGELVVADIGITREVIGQTGPRLFLLEAVDAARAFPARAPDSHKGTYGHVLVVAGSLGKTGAAVLAASGALLTGAGLVTVATAAPALPMVAGARPEIMTEPLAATASGGISREAVERAVSLAKKRDAVVLGPGLGQDPGTRDFIREFVRRCPVPLLVDADGLNALAPSASSRAAGALEALRRDSPTVVTPHPGEMARLAGLKSDEVQRRRLETARALAQETGALVVLKGHRTLLVEADGRAAVNPTGNPGLASGGTGDVLAGMIGALLARHPARVAAAAGVYLHGLAGDRAAARRGRESLLAGDVLDSIPEALQSLPAPGPGDFSSAIT